MSVDLYMNFETCKACGHQPESININYTYNVSPMWYKIYPDDKGMIYIDGMTGREAYEKLNHARDRLINNKDEFKKLEPANGWGTYEGFIDLLSKAIYFSTEYPDLVWSASR